MISPLESVAELTASAVACCCHFAVWWYEAVVTLGTRAAVLHTIGEGCESATRNVLDEIIVEDKFRESDAGHLRSVASIFRNARVWRRRQLEENDKAGDSTVGIDGEKRLTMEDGAERGEWVGKKRVRVEETLYQPGQKLARELFSKRQRAMA